MNTTPKYYTTFAFFYVKKGQHYEDKRDGIVYVYNEGRRKRLLSKIFSGIQYVLWKVGINTHNPISKECTPDFSFCTRKGT